MEVLNGDNLQLLEMSDGVRNVALHRISSPVYKLDDNETYIKFERQIFEGGIYEVQGRKDGYSPRMA